jgi:hypothetical protein
MRSVAPVDAGQPVLPRMPTSSAYSSRTPGWPTATMRIVMFRGPRTQVPVVKYRYDEQ